jgi:hypothetical protein
MSVFLRQISAGRAAGVAPGVVLTDGSYGSDSGKARAQSIGRGPPAM